MGWPYKCTPVKFFFTCHIIFSLILYYIISNIDTYYSLFLYAGEGTGFLLPDNFFTCDFFFRTGPTCVMVDYNNNNNNNNNNFYL